MKTFITLISLLVMQTMTMHAQYFPCGRCFDYTSGEASITFDFSHVEQVACDDLEYFMTAVDVSNPGNEILLSPFGDLPPSWTYFLPPGEYIFCLNYSCAGIVELTLGQTQTVTELCCIAVTIGGECSEPPVCHFTIDPDVSWTLEYYASSFDASSSSNVDSYSWEWGDYTSSVTSSPFAVHEYSTIFPELYPEVNVCLVGSNACGMSRYCCTYYTFGEADDYYGWCDLPFSIYSPPEIIPVTDGSSVSFDLSDFACGSGADVYLDPGDGSGEVLVSGCNDISYTYESEGQYQCCIRVYFPCISLCFCFPFRPEPPFSCIDAYDLYCNTYGNEIVNDANDPSLHNGFSPIFDSWDRYDYCEGVDDGCDQQNVINTSQLFSAHEVIYRVENPSINGDNDIVVDLVPLDGGLDVDLFVFEECTTYWPGFFSVFEGCAGSSTYPAGVRDAVYIEDAISSQYYMVVDGGPGSNDQEGRFQVSVTCGDLCTKDARSFLQCGKAIIDSTTHFTADNQASYYCGCDNDNGKARAGNYGPENIHILDVIETDTVSISLDILTPGRDLELYLLDECDVESCVRNSRNTPGASEHIQKLLTPGRYYVIVEGFRGQTGKYRLTVNGCQCALSCSNATPQLAYDFENFAPGTAIPNGSTQNWWIGDYVSSDPQDNTLVAFIEEKANQNNKLVLNSANYNFSDVTLGLPLDTSGVHKLSFDLTLKYVANKLQNGIIGVFESISLLDATWYNELRIRYGQDVNGKNFANLFLYTENGGLLGTFTDSIKLASITPFVPVSPGTQLKSFAVTYIFDIDKGLGSLIIDNTCIYTGQFAFAQHTDFFFHNRGVEFISAKAQSYMEIDNIVYGNCGSCSGGVEEDCDGITFTNIGSNNNLVALTFEAPDVDPKSLVGWQVTDETTGQTIELQTGFWNGFVPGHTCRICVKYLDANGCLRECCIRIRIPSGCTLVTPDHIAQPNQLLFEFEANDPNLQPVLFAVDETGQTNSTGIFNFTSAGSYHVCCLFYDPVLKEYILCCRQYCIDFPYNCGILFTYSVIPGSTNTTVNFSRNSPSADSYLWTFGDGTTSSSSATSVSHSYPSNATSYQVCLTITDDCKGSCTYCIEVFLREPLMLIIDDVCGAVNQIVDIPITAVNFENLVTGSFTVKLNNTGAKFISIDNNAFTQIFSSNVINGQTAVVNWADVQSNPLTIPDFTVIATIKVQITSPNFISAAITFASDPVQLKFTGINNDQVPVSVNNGTICRQQQVSIAGEIKSGNNHPMPNVIVWRRSPPDVSVTTDAAGKYSVNAEIGKNYTVSPEKNTGFLDGVGPLDLVMVLRHVSFVQRFTDPKQWVAADVDRNGKVEILDYKLINDLLLRKITSFPGGKSWRFMPANHVFTNPSDPLTPAVPESLFFQPLQQSALNAHFTGLKLGDVNFSAIPGAHFGQITARNACHLFEIQDRLLVTGETINVQLQTNNFTSVISLLAELEFNTEHLTYEGFVSSDLNGLGADQVSGDSAQAGLVFVSWTTTGSETLADHSNFLTLRFKVKQGGSWLNTLLSLRSASEIVFDNLETYCIELDQTSPIFDIQPVSLHVVARPNPFRDEVIIALELSEDQDITLQVCNAVGQVVYEAVEVLRSGQTDLRLTATELGQHTGVLYIQVKTATQIFIAPVVRLDH